MIQVTGAIALRVHEHGGTGDISIAIPTGKDEDWKLLPFNFVPLNCRDPPPDQFRVMLAFDFRRRAHDFE